jgi:hypothetical protein
MNRSVLLAITIFTCLNLPAFGADDAPSPYAKWTHGPSSDPHFFPIAVWLQDPRDADKYRAAGINIYDGLWKGPTEEQLAVLDKSGMKVICEQNAVALRHLDDPTIIGWLQPDEPDNAQERADHHGYGPPTPPQTIVNQYNRWKQADPTRPVELGLGQGMAWNDYYGRGVRTGHAEDYPEYIKGADILSFDIYPVVHESPKVAGKLWYVGKGVDHLVSIAQPGQAVWNCIECTHIGNAQAKPTPQQVRCEVWISLVHGSRGIIWFVHQFAPRENDAALLDDPEMLAAVTAINKQITDLAPVLNSPNIADIGHAPAKDGPGSVDVMIKRYEGSTYLFAVEMNGAEVESTINFPGANQVNVLGENRTIQATNSSFTDNFAPWDVHIYQLKD